MRLRMLRVVMGLLLAVWLVPSAGAQAGGGAILVRAGVGLASGWTSSTSDWPGASAPGTASRLAPGQRKRWWTYTTAPTGKPTLRGATLSSDASVAAEPSAGSPRWHAG